MTLFPQKSIDLAFKVFRSGGKNGITKEELGLMLTKSFKNMSELEIARIFKEIDSNGDGLITKGI